MNLAETVPASRLLLPTFSEVFFSLLWVLLILAVIYAVVRLALRDSATARRRRRDADSDEAWRAEAARRLADVRSGTVEPVDADEHFAQLRKSLED